MAALDELNGAINRARGEAEAAVGSSRNGIDAILGRQGDIDSAIIGMNGDAGHMEGIAGTLQNQGNAMFESGTKVTDQALETLGTGLGFVNMDASSSPLVAEALKLYGRRDPDAYVAQAAQDVQSSFDNAQKQQGRQLARQGVSLGSGASLALSQLREKAFAVARAASMFRARQAGLNDQASAFQGLLANNANKFLQTGGQLASIGSSMRAQGASALGNAGNLLGNAGALRGSAGKLSLDFGNTLAGAYNALAGVQLKQADLTNATEGLRVSALKGGGGGGGRLVSTNTGRHYGVGGELLETGNDEVDAQLQMARDAQPTTYEKNLGLA